MHTQASVAAALILLLFLAPGTARVAAQEAEVAAAAGWYDPFGDDFGDTDPGLGIDGVVRVRATDRLAVGGGVQWNSHDVPFADDDWSVLSLFAEPRLLLLSRDRTVVPFVSARAGWLRQSIERDDGSERTATGFGGGGFLGLLFQVGERVGVEASIPVYHLSFGDYELDDAEQAGTDSSGGVWGGRVGLVLAF